MTSAAFNNRSRTLSGTISECLAYIGFDKEREHGVTVRAAIDVAVKGVSTCGQMIYDCCLCLGRSLFGYRFLD